ncbi:MAG: glycine--tRNA ligase subunit alpha [Caldiserica bacterium]|nr:glycine--tRNA ligase subunit alpha [Caldisericota bacterium]
MRSGEKRVRTFQDLVLALHEYWRDRGCVIFEPYDVEKGAGTFNPATFFGCLGPDPWRVAYVEPSRRPTDGRYGENPIRLRLHHQYQVILKPPPPDIQDLYLGSLEYVGIDLREHDVKFSEDDWESPTLGAWGVGWQVWLDEMEITQFTYFQQMGGIDLDPVSVELTYGLERIALFLQGVESAFELRWSEDVKYGEIWHEKERQFSIYNFEQADVERIRRMFELAEAEARACLEAGLVFPAYDHTLHCSHLFNVLDARGAISVAERESYIARIRELARACAQNYLKLLEERRARVLA